MKEQLARTISRYRKEKGLTQNELAQALGLSFQAVSKWENAQSLPDITLLPHENDRGEKIKPSRKTAPCESNKLAGE